MEISRRLSQKAWDDFTRSEIHSEFEIVPVADRTDRAIRFRGVKRSYRRGLTLAELLGVSCCRGYLYWNPGGLLLPAVRAAQVAHAAAL